MPSSLSLSVSPFPPSCCFHWCCPPTSASCCANKVAATNNNKEVGEEESPVVVVCRHDEQKPRQKEQEEEEEEEEAKAEENQREIQMRKRRRRQTGTIPITNIAEENNNNNHHKKRRILLTSTATTTAAIVGTSRLRHHHSLLRPAAHSRQCSSSIPSSAIPLYQFRHQFPSRPLPYQHSPSPDRWRHRLHPPHQQHRRHHSTPSSSSFLLLIPSSSALPVVPCPLLILLFALSFMLLLCHCPVPTGASARPPVAAHQLHHQPQIFVGTDDSVLIQTPLGRVRGFRQKFDGKSVHTFLGVPYAKRPTGMRRFALPEMIEPWEGEFRADTPARTCYYPIDTMFPDFPGAEMWNPPNEIDEDCLSMNIWVPEQHGESGTAFPVMVWIYGGGFYSGSPSLDLYDGRVLAVHERAVVVNINYRLGAFGFLYLGDDTPVPGNMGLRDQQLALRWIHRQIAHFGGDPARVTLFGESAGGASAAAHLFAPDSFPLFGRLIAKSGAIVNNWATKSKAAIRQISFQLARQLNCTESSSNNNNKRLLLFTNGNGGHQQEEEEEQEWEQQQQQQVQVKRIVGCMSRVPAAIVQRESDTISESLMLPMNFAFVPIEEDTHFFMGNLFEKLRHKQFKKDVSILLGTVRDEGTYWLPYYLHKYGFSFNHTISPEDQFNQALVSEAEYTKAFDAFLPYFGNSQLVRHALMHAYGRISPPDHHHHTHIRAVERWRDGVARFLGDYFFTCAIIEFADLVSEEVFGSVYMYYFTKRSSANPWPRWMGVMHGYEIEYVFGLPLRSPQQYDPRELDAERAFAEKIMEFWGQFARTGQPIDFWPKYNRITRKSLVLSEEIARGNSHRIYVDVHGKCCRLLQEAQAVARLPNGQRHAKLTDRLSTKEEANLRIGNGAIASSSGSDTWQPMRSSGQSAQQQQKTHLFLNVVHVENAMLMMITTVVVVAITTLLPMPMVSLLIHHHL